MPSCTCKNIVKLPFGYFTFALFLGIIKTSNTSEYANMFYAYIRVSTEQQADSGLGIEAQKTTCLKYAGDEPVAVFVDVISGKTPLEQRTALLGILGEVEKGDCVLVAKRDRIGRDPICVAMIEAAFKRLGVKIISVAGEGTDGDDPASVLMRRMIDAFAEFERLTISTRTKAALQAKKARGEATGGSIPIGKKIADDGRTLIDDTKEQELITHILALKQEKLSLQKIADKLNSSGFTKRNGSLFNKQNIYDIIKINTAHRIS